MNRLPDRVIILTGAAGGAGVPYVRRFIDEGARLVLVDVQDTNPAFKSLVDSNRVRFVRTDIGSPADCEALARAALDAFGRVDVLINNAALFTTLARRPFEEIPDEEWERVLRINVTGTFNCIRAITPIMKDQGRGKIINIASNVVHKGLPLLLHYVASKGAVMAMTRALARELGPNRITVNAIAPGYILHEGTELTDQGRNERVIALRSINRTQVPEDLTGALVFLSSSDSDFITGQTLIVDGGEVFV